MKTHDEKIAGLKQQIATLEELQRTNEKLLKSLRQELADSLAQFDIGEVVLYRGLKWVISMRKLLGNGRYMGVNYYGRQLKKNGEPSLREVHMYETDKITKVTP